MKKTLANDPIFVNAMLKGCGEIDNYLVNNTTNYVIFENGFIYRFEKPSIKTSFCFGYGQNGISTDEDMEFAEQCSQSAKSKYVFFANNLERFNELEKMLEGDCWGDNLYVTTPRENYVFVNNIFTDHDAVYGYYHSLKDKAYKLTQKDKDKFKKSIHIAKDMMKKRLETYWKRFGSSKLRTWTYLVD